MNNGRLSSLIEVYNCMKIEGPADNDRSDTYTNFVDSSNILISNF